MTESEQAIRLRWQESDNEVEQILGVALGYPRYCDDQVNFPGTTEADGVCIGDNVPATLAASASQKIGELQSELWQMKVSIDGRNKAIKLLNAGLESTCEILDQIKQENRRLREELSGSVDRSS